MPASLIGQKWCAMAVEFVDTSGVLELISSMSIFSMLKQPKKVKIVTYKNRGVYMYMHCIKYHALYYAVKTNLIYFSSKHKFILHLYSNF